MGKESPRHCAAPRPAPLALPRPLGCGGGGGGSDDDDDDATAGVRRNAAAPPVLCRRPAQLTRLRASSASASSASATTVATATATAAATMPAPGIKKAFRGDGSGSLLSPHPQTPMQVAAIFGAEFLGTALLLFVGCMGSMLPIGLYDLENRHLQTAMVFGITVMFVIQIIGHTSVAHINPAVSLCSLILGKIRIVTFGVYVLAQMLGAVVGVGLLKAVTPSSAWNASEFGCCSSCLNIPHPQLSNVQAFLAEFMVTCVLIFLVCGVWDVRNKVDSAAPIKFGLTIMGIALAEGNFTGASMNPARSFGPALWEGNWERHWVYWAGPLTAAVFATLFYSYVLNTDYSRKESAEEVSLTAIKGDGQSASRNAAEPDE